MAVENLTKFEIEDLEANVEQAFAIAFLLNTNGDTEEISGNAAAAMMGCLDKALKTLKGDASNPKP